MSDGDPHSHRIFAGVGVLEQQVAAGVLDIADEVWRGIHATFLAHESDGSRRIDL
jgi:hypothetical protein